MQGNSKLGWFRFGRLQRDCCLSLRQAADGARQQLKGVANDNFEQVMMTTMKGAQEAICALCWLECHEVCRRDGISYYLQLLTDEPVISAVGFWDIPIGDPVT